MNRADAAAIPAKYRSVTIGRPLRQAIEMSVRSLNQRKIRTAALHPRERMEHLMTGARPLEQGSVISSAARDGETVHRAVRANSHPAVRPGAGRVVERVQRLQAAGGLPLK